MKKTIIFGSLFLAAVLLYIFVPKIVNRFFLSTSLDSYDEAIIIINENYPTDLIVYGDEIEFRDNFEYRVVSDFSEESLESSDEYSYRFLVVINVTGNMEFSDEELSSLLVYLRENNYGFFYFGSTGLDSFQRCNYFDSDLDPSSEGFGLVNYYGQEMVVQGFWSEYDANVNDSNPETLPSIILFNVVEVIDSNE